MLLQLGNFLLLNDVFILVYCRIEGGIPPLVELLESQDLKVQRAAAGALRTLAFKNDENKSQVRYQNFKITRPTL
jgi:cell envelope opacity-associated protein A